MHKVSPILFGAMIAALVALPFVSMAVMSAPDTSVNAGWQGASSSAVSATPATSTNSTTNPSSVSTASSDLLSGLTIAASATTASTSTQALFDKGTFDISATVTAIDTANNRIAVNGFWIERSWIDRLDSLNIPGVPDLGSHWASVSVGDKVRVQGTVQNGAISISSMQMTTAANRSALQTRLQTLMQQLKNLLLGLVNGSSSASVSTGTASSTNSTTTP